MNLYNEKFKDIHDLLKGCKCKPTFSFEREYREGPGIMISMDGCTDSYFYEPFEALEANDKTNKDWEEVVAAVLDVVTPTKMSKAVKGEIRFDITYSQRVNKYSMYISLPTDSRSIPVSKNVYKSQEEVLDEINKYVVKAKAKQQIKNIEQISLF